jgi:AraC-like DNA-binding protein
MPYTSELFKFQPFEKDELNVGFKNYNLKEGEIYHSMHKQCNQIYLLLEGKLEMNSSEALGKTIEKNEIFFIPMSADMSCKAILPCSIQLFFFNHIQHTCERAYFRELYGLYSQKDHCFQAFAMQRPLLKFTHDLITYFGQLIDVPAYQKVKYEEFLYLLRFNYAKKELACLFHPIVGKSIDFRMFIMKNYLKVKNINELVKLSGLKRKTFDRQFCDEFGIPPYQWILKQKAKHIRYALSETNDQMQEIMRKYGFLIAPHFTRFCKEYFNYTPLELRKRLRLEKVQARY